MSIPKSKMLSASRAIMAIANKNRESREIKHKHIQKQTVNINLQRTSSDVRTDTISHQPVYPTISDELTSSALGPLAPDIPASVGPIMTRSVEIDEKTEPVVETNNSQIMGELNNLYSLVNNYETVARVLILIIDLIQSNPLMVNKFIVPTENTFRDLICVLTDAEDVDIKRCDDLGCSISSKKYDLIDDIYVVKDGEPRSLKYGYPEVIRLFDRFKITVKMIVHK